VGDSYSVGSLDSSWITSTQSQSNITTDNQSDAHLGHATNFSFSLRFSFRQLRFVIFVAPSLTRGRVCNVRVRVRVIITTAIKRL
jgi:hypothetical protein